MKRLMTLVAVLCVAGSAMAGTVYNLTNDWVSSPGNMPNWSFGNETAPTLEIPPGQNFSAMPHTDIGWADIYWNGGEPWILKCYNQVWVIPVGTVAFHPSNNLAAVARFTTPEDGTYAISAVFTGLDAGIKDVHVLVDGSSIYDFALDGLASTSLAPTQVFLAQGKTVEFIVGPYGFLTSDATAVDATVTLIPEPVSVLLLGLGGLYLKKRK